MAEEPSDPMGTIAQGAVAAHEAYRSFLDAGFKQSEALYLVGQMITSGMNQPGDGHAAE